MSKIAVVGSLNVDWVVRLGRFPRPGETLPGKNLESYPGGKGGNQAYAAARLLDEERRPPGGDPLSVAMFGRVGGDPHGAWLKDNLKAAGVDASAVGEDGDAPTGLAIIAIDDAGQNQIIVVAGANGRFTPERLDESAAALAQSSLLLLQLEVPIETVTRAARAARTAGTTVILDPAPARPLPGALFADLDYLTPNESELGVLLGHPPSERRLSRDEAAAGARALRERGARNVIVKLGDAGALLATDAGQHFVSAIPVTAVDTTGAGDAFNAAFSVALAERRPAVEAARFAAAAAALSVTRVGAQPAMPTRAEVETLLAGRIPIVSG